MRADDGSDIPSESSLGSVTPMTDASFDMADVTSRGSGHGPAEHRTFYIREDMVKIQVENTLFRLPIYVLARDSAYFAALLRDHELSETLHLADTAVSSSAFANFLTVLLPRLRAKPLSALHQWTDVLNLSSKWGFDDIRVASVEAILPLASPVEKIALGRAHGGFSDWIASACMDLLERKDSLTVDEARRLPIEDVVAIAKGRCDLRMEKPRPRAELEAFVRDLFALETTGRAHAAPSDVANSSMVSHPQVNSPAVIGSLQVDAQDDVIRTVSRWMTQLEHDKSNKAAKTCVVQWIRDDPPTRSKVFLDLALARGWQCYLSGKNPNNSFMDQWDVKIFQVGRALHDLHLPSCPALYRSSLTREAALRLTDNWVALLQIDLTNSTDRIAEDGPWATMVQKTQYLIACADSTCEGRLLDWSVFAPLWTAMATFFVRAPNEHKYTASRLLQKLLDKVQKSISKNEVSREMDLFYRTLEDARKEREPSRDAFDKVLINIIDGRHWP